MKQVSKIRKIAFLGDYWPRKCGIATFTSDLLAAVAAEHPQSQCFSVAVNDIKGGYEYPDVVNYAPNDVSADGQRFVLAEPVGEETAERKIHVVENWLAEFVNRE